MPKHRRVERQLTPHLPFTIYLQELSMYSCQHCELSCENRTRFNRHMRHHMTTDVKFLLTQDSDSVEKRPQETKTNLTESFKPEKIEEEEKPKLEMTNCETDLKDSASIAVDKEVDTESATERKEVPSEQDMEDDLDEDFMDDEDYFDSDTTLPLKTETGLQETDFMDDEDYFDSDPLPPKQEANPENSIDINQILQRYSKVITNKSEHNVEQGAGTQTQVPLVKAVPDITVKQENPSVEIAKSVNNFTIKQETPLLEIATNSKKQTKTKDFVCDVCEKQYASNYSLKQHHLLHTGEKPHKCEQCGTSFARKGYLTKHVMTHNSI
eukprot:GFUD01033253.1.p1 GENE.GFUD01033253.1~~GFUD01033253.1.p1  ORF type:complete len:325 (-),score=69.86 GFUD01033253.1:50-1024(-)